MKLRLFSCAFLFSSLALAACGQESPPTASPPAKPAETAPAAVATTSDGPTDAQVQAAIDEVTSRVKGLEPPKLFEERARAVNETMNRLGVAKLTLAQLELLKQRGMLSDPGLRPPTLARFTELARAETADGAVAAVHRLSFLTPDIDMATTPEQKREARRAQGLAAVFAFKHPAIRKAWLVGRGQEVLGRMAKVDPATFTGVELIDALERALKVGSDPDVPAPTPKPEPGAAAPPPTPPAPTIGWDVIVRLPAVLEVLQDSRSGQPPEQVKRIRDCAIALVDSLKPESDNDRRSIRIVRGFFEGAHARGELIGKPAPSLNFTWTSALPYQASPAPSTPPNPASLAEIKDRIVVVVFFSVPAKPSLRALLDSEQLARRYNGTAFSVLAVTSLQGTATDFAGPKPVKFDTSKSPDLEHRLTAQLLERRKHTCRVAFVDSVFQGDYGVVRLPTVAIIDPKGVVRLRLGDLRDDNFAAACEAIDRLIEEFKLPKPTPLPDPNSASAKPADAAAPSEEDGGK